MVFSQYPKTTSTSERFFECVFFLSSFPTSYSLAVILTKDEGFVIVTANLWLRISPYSTRMRENTDQKKLRIWTVSLPIQSECGKTRTRRNSVFGHFPRSVMLCLQNAWNNRICFHRYGLIITSGGPTYRQSVNSEIAIQWCSWKKWYPKITS